METLNKETLVREDDISDFFALIPLVLLLYLLELTFFVWVLSDYMAQELV